jgi:hypothetical protein
LNGSRISWRVARVPVFGEISEISAEKKSLAEQGVLVIERQLNMERYVMKFLTSKYVPRKCVDGNNSKYVSKETRKLMLHIYIKKFRRKLSKDQFFYLFSLVMDLGHVTFRVSKI